MGDLLQRLGVIAFELDDEDILAFGFFGAVFLSVEQFDAGFLGEFLHEAFPDFAGGECVGAVGVEPAFDLPALLEVEREVAFEAVFLLFGFEEFFGGAEVFAEVTEAVFGRGADLELEAGAVFFLLFHELESFGCDVLGAGEDCGEEQDQFDSVFEEEAEQAGVMPVDGFDGVVVGGADCAVDLGVGPLDEAGAFLDAFGGESEVDAEGDEDEGDEE
ncbi:MAG: hypothetical protein RI897_2492 [Verrucomicrobiota bacterium]